MFPGLTPADCQAAAFRHDQLVRDGQRQQRAARVPGAETGAAATASSPRLGVGQLLRRAGLGRTRERIGTAIAASPQAEA